ncbi:MAG: hypothetical protein QXW61_05160 [Sulfolobales archaeon]
MKIQVVGHSKPGCGGFPHGCELNEGGVGWGYPEWVEADDVGVDERFSEVDEAKG